MALSGFPAYDFWNGAIDTIPRDPTGTIKMDLVETDTAFIVTAQMPGVKKDEIKVVYENDVLTVAVNRSGENVVNDENTHVHFKECFRTSSSRSIRFQRGKINPDNIDAKYENGQLTVNLNFVDNFKDNSVVNVKIN